MECPCYSECKDCAPGFQKVIDLKNAGLIIYRHTTHTEDVDKKTGNVEHAVDTTEDVYILHNTTDKDISSADYWPEIEQNTIKCPRCRKIQEHARILLKKGPSISGNHVKGICDHCKMKDASCFGCQEVVKSFVPSKPGQTDVGKERVKHWLGKIKLLLDDTSKDKKMPHSDIQTNQLCRNLKNPVREPEVEQLFGPHELDSDSTIQQSKEKKKVAHFPQLKKLDHPILFKDPLKRGGMSFANEDLEFSYADNDFSKTIKYTTPPNNREVVAQDSSIVFEKIFEDAIPLSGTKEKANDKNKYGVITQGHIHEKTEFKPTETKQSLIIAKYGIEKKFNKPDKQAPKDIYGRPVKLPYDNGQWSDETNVNQKVNLYTNVKDSQHDRQRKYKSTETLVTKVKDITKGHLKANSIIFPSKSRKKYITKQKSSSELIEHTTHKHLAKGKEEKTVAKEDEHAKQQIHTKNRIPGERTDTDNIKAVKIEKNSSIAAKKAQQAPENGEKIQKDAQKSTLKAETKALKAELDAQKAALIAEKNAKKAEKDTLKALNDAQKDTFKSELDAIKAASKAGKNANKAENDALLAKKDARQAKPNGQRDAEKVEKDALKAEKNSKKAENDARQAKIKAQRDAEKVEKDAPKAEKNAKKAENDARQAKIKAQRDAEKVEKDALKAEKNAKKAENDARQAKIKPQRDAEKVEKDALMAEKNTLQAKQDARQAEHKAQRDKEKTETEAIKAAEKALKEKAQKPSLIRDKTKKGSIDSLSEGVKKNNNLMSNKKPSTTNTNIIETSLHRNENKTKGDISLDDLISKLVKLKQLAHEGRLHHTSPDLRITQNYIKVHCEQHTHQKNEHCLLCANSDIALEFASLCPDNEIKEEISDVIVGNEIIKFRPPMMAQMEDVSEENDTEEHISAEPTAATPKTPHVHSTGYWRYSLSDRKFIDNGWTQLPTEKVVRKMNVYRMRPARPEFDWFEHNKNKRLMEYDTGEKLAEFDENGRGRWFYRNGRMALAYYDAEEQHAGQRFVLYSNGEPDERGRSRPYTLLATFDYLGNGIVFDHSGKIRLKYNQTEGVVLDRSIGPVSHWKWHTLNDPPVLQQVMLDTQIPHKDPEIMKMGNPGENKPRQDDEDMLAIEFDNIVKEKSKKLSQKFRPFQIRMKALKINEHFSLRVLDQATVYLLYRDGTTNLKLNIGMVLDNKEIVDTDTADVGIVSNNLEKLPARTESLVGLQKSIAIAHQYDRMRTERERKLHPGEPNASVDKLVAGISRPIPRQLLSTVPSDSPMISVADHCKCNKKPTTTNVYYDTRFY